MTRKASTDVGGRTAAHGASGNGSAGAAAPPTRADGIELIGEYEDSGFKDPPYIVRRADGQVIQLPHLLYAIAEQADGRHDLEQIARAAGAAAHTEIGPGDVEILVDKQLRPMGVLAAADGTSPQLQKVDPMLALKLRAAVVPEGAVQVLARIFGLLFWPPIVVAVLGALVALDVWLFGFHGVAPGVRTALYQPIFMLAVLGLIVLSAAFHEIGHATACKYGGARPGHLGAGIYIVWPAFYSEVTDAYRLGRGGRVRTDLGGVYFNAIFSLATYAAYFLTGWEPLLLVVVLQHFEIVHQFLPFLRLDGYYVIADLTGVPDMFSRIKPVLRGLLPWKRADERASELHWWARAVVTGWVLLLVPVLLYMFGGMLLAMPRLVATAWDSGSQQYHTLVRAAGRGDVARAAFATLSIAMLSLPVASIGWTLARSCQRGAFWCWKRNLATRAGLLVAAPAALALAAFVLWPRPHSYTPLQPGERGTVVAALPAASRVSNGQAPSYARPAQTAAQRAATPANATSTTPDTGGPAGTATATTPTAPAQGSGGTATATTPTSTTPTPPPPPPASGAPCDPATDPSCTTPPPPPPPAAAP